MRVSSVVFPAPCSPNIKSLASSIIGPRLAMAFKASVFTKLDPRGDVEEEASAAIF